MLSQHWVAGELADDEGGRDCAVPDGRSQSQDLFPLRSDQLQIELAADQRSERWMIALLARHIQPLIGEIADAGCEAESQQMAECKDVIREARRIGVVPLDPKVRFMVEQAIENMRRIAAFAAITLV
jgi:hypothetical protein